MEKCKYGCTIIKEYLQICKIQILVTFYDQKRLSDYILTMKTSREHQNNHQTEMICFRFQADFHDDDFHARLLIWFWPIPSDDDVRFFCCTFETYLFEVLFDLPSRPVPINWSRLALICSSADILSNCPKHMRRRWLIQRVYRLFLQQKF